MAPQPPKLDPESLVLRAGPRRVVRFKRNLLIGIAAIACLAIFGATWLALGQSSAIRPQTGQEQYSIDRKRAPDELASLPASYDKLGQPLPGDLGPPIVAREKSLGLSPTDASFKPNPEDDAARAERMRRTQQAQQAKEAGVFFQLAKTDHATPADMATSADERGISAASADMTATSDSSNSRLALDPARDPNDQQRKLDFLSQKTDKDIYNPHALQMPVSPYELLAGTIIPASLITGLNSDLPGLVVAQITENIFDSVKGATLILPMGSRLIGSYDSVIAFGQSRALVVWQRIIMPDGSSIQIDNLPATDAEGYSGLSDQVDYHTWTLLKGIALSTLLGVGSQVTFGNSNSNLVEAIRESTQESTNQAGQQIVEKDLDTQPTIIIRPGTILRVVLHKDLVLRPYHGEE